MPLTAFDDSNPLLDSSVQEIKRTYDELEFDWVAATQVVNSSGDIQVRSFNEVEFDQGNVAWRVEVGQLDPELDSQRYYVGDIPTLVHRYSGNKFKVGIEDNASDFRGWNYKVEEHKVSNSYTDKPVVVLTWSLYNEASSDSLTISEGGSVVSGNASSLTIEVQTKGVGFRADQELKSFLVQNGNGAPNNTLSVDGFDAEPQLLSGNRLYIQRPTITRSISNEGQPPTLLARLQVVLYGEYYLQGIEMFELYDQGIVYHPEGTEESIRLKPPGKAYLDDNFNALNQGNITGLRLEDV